MISMVTALLSVGMALVVQQGHELVTRMLGVYRWILTALAVLTFLAAVSSAIPAADMTGSPVTYADDLSAIRQVVWWAAAGWAWAFVLLQAAGWLMRRMKPKNRPWWPGLQVMTIILALVACGLLGVSREATGMAAVWSWSGLYFLRAVTLRRAIARVAL